MVWDRGVLYKRSIDAQRHGNLYFPTDVAYRALLVGPQGTAEITRNHNVGKPRAVYPTWVYGEDTIERLEELLATLSATVGASAPRRRDRPMSGPCWARSTGVPGA